MLIPGSSADAAVAPRGSDVIESLGVGIGEGLNDPFWSTFSDPTELTEALGDTVAEGAGDTLGDVVLEGGGVNLGGVEETDPRGDMFDMLPSDCRGNNLGESFCCCSENDCLGDS